MACLHENWSARSEDCEDQHGLECGPPERWTDVWIECHDCSEIFTPSEFEREMEQVQAERERIERGHADDLKFHIWQEGKVA
jgi:hypothetical protein